MVQVVIPIGRPKGDIVRAAYADVGLSDAEFDIEPEEINKGLRILNAMMGDWPLNLMGYQQPFYGLGLPEDASGLDDEAINAVTTALAYRLAAAAGKMLSPDVKAQYASSMAQLRAAYATVPTMAFARNTPHGSGTERQVSGIYLRTD